MAKSKSSCFNLIACGSDSSLNEDLRRTEIKATADKRGGSFRKRSARQSVLSSTVILEVQSAPDKHSPEAASTNLHPLTNTSIPEKISASQWKDETMPLLSSATVNPKLDDTLIVTGGASNGDFDVQKSVAIVIQSAIRSYLARKAFYKLKNVIKSQAFVRGHLVRRQAVGTLRCVLAIVKMQALVRARHARLSLEGLSIQEKHDEKLKTDQQRVDPLEYFGTEANKTNASIEKLLASRFTCQLLESNPKTKPIYINCDPERPESAWKWLERWMSISSSKIMDPQKSQLNPEHQENGANVNSSVSEIVTEASAEVVSESPDVKSDVQDTEVLLEGEENSDTYIADDFEIQACKPITSSGKISSSEMSYDLEDGCWGISPQTYGEIRNNCRETQDSVSSQVAIQSITASQTKIGANSEKPEQSTENSKHTVERLASEQIVTEGNKFILGSRKSTNPAFAAVRSKFEEMSSTATSGKSISSGFHDAAVESRLDSPSSLTCFITRAKDLSEELVSHDPRIQMWGSECGTELSISSTLDSPDRPQTEGEEFLHEIQSTDKENSDKINFGNVHAEAINASSMLASVHNSSCPGYVQPGNKLQEVDGNSAYPVSPLSHGPVKVHPSEQCVSDMHSQLDTETNQSVEVLCSEGSLRSHITVPDSHGIPSSQISQTSKRNMSDNSSPSQKHTSQSVGKRSTASQTHDLSVKNSTEHVPKDSNSGKRRNSFSYEQRVSNSNPLPSYMQATESARAKANIIKSPKLNLDVQNKGNLLKKRHSLPVTTNKQGSPQMLQSMPQVQQNMQGNAARSPQTSIERKWQRW